MELRDARRIALRAQGLDRPHKGVAGPARLSSVVRNLGVIQLDSVNVLARAHYLPLFSRVGPYDTNWLDRAYGAAPRRLVEQWGHEACLVPPATHQLLAALRRPWSRQLADDVEARVPGLLDRVEHTVARHGPATARTLAGRLGRGEQWDGPLWRTHALDRALAALWHGGTLATAARNTQFERVYNLTERVLPASAVRTWDEAEARRELALAAVRHLGIGTTRCVADFWRTKIAPTAATLQDLAAEGLIARVNVSGWRGPAWRDPAATQPRNLTGSALLSPFDPLVFERSRLLALFGVHYRIGIYTPAAQRTTGYYSLPFLLGERIVARYDLKAERRSAALVVNGAFLEDPAVRGEVSAAQVAAAVTPHLWSMAHWLGLSHVVVPDAAAGNTTAELRRALTPYHG